MRATHRTLCADCGVNTTPRTERRGRRRTGTWEYYMVTQELWDAAGLGHGFLCIGCLEHRVGRRLTPADFTDFPINDPSIWDTARLASRKGDDVNHWVRPVDVVEAVVEGRKVVTLCGGRRSPFDPLLDRPVCPECDRIAAGMS